MAELADAHGSGPCESNFMQVQLLSSAPKNPVIVMITGFCFVIVYPGGIVAAVGRYSGKKHKNAMQCSHVAHISSVQSCSQKDEWRKAEMKYRIIMMIMAVVLAAGLIGAPNAAAKGTDVNETADQAAVSDNKEDEEVQAPEAVDSVKAKATKRGKTKIRWSSAENADGYYVYVASEKNGEYNRIKNVKGEDNTSCTHKYRKLRKNKKYFYKVYAYKKVNGKTLLSDDTDKDPAKNTLSYKKKIRMKATAYSGGGLCANGKRCKVGRVAVDPRVIPLGTWLYVKGYGFCQACDTGGAIKGRRIDLYFNSESQCNRYGVRGTSVYVLRK